MAEIKAHIDPTRNGGKKAKLSCRCDPDKASKDEKGNRRVFMRHENPGMFRPLGVDAGLYITVCGQCKEIQVFGLMLPENPQQPRPGKILLA